MNTYELDENMVNWIKNNMNEYKQVPASEDPRYLTKAPYGVQGCLFRGSYGMEQREKD